MSPAAELPAGWELGTLAEAVGADGLICDGDWVESKDQDPNGQVRLIQLADIGEGKFLDKSARFMTRERAVKLRCTFLEPGDVLVARMPDPLGRACVFPGDPRPAVAAVDICILRPEQGLTQSNWLHHAINTPQFRLRIQQFTKGTTRKRISRKNLERLELPRPPLAEQKRIAAVLDKADAILSKRQQAIALTEDLPLAIYCEYFGSPVANNRAWPASTLGKEADISSGATPSKREASFWDGTIPWVSPKDMKRPYIDDSQDHVSSTAVDRGRIKIVPSGAVLIVVRGMILMHTMPVALSQGPLTINQDLKALRPSGRVLSEFLLWTLRAMSGYLLARVSTAAHGTKRLELDVLREAPLITPPLELQERFCRSIKACRTLEARLRAADGVPLFESFSQRASRGEL